MNTYNGALDDDCIKASEVKFTPGFMHVILSDGHIINAPLAKCYGLADATPEQRENWELIARGTGIHWEEIDEDLSIAGLIRQFGMWPSGKENFPTRTPTSTSVTRKKRSLK